MTRQRSKALQRGISRIIVCFVTTFCASGALAQKPSYKFFDQPYSRDYEKTMVDRMNAGIGRFFDRYNERITAQRDQYWERDLSSPAAYRQSIQDNLDRFRTIIGVVGERGPAKMTEEAAAGAPGPVAETERYTVQQVRWPVKEGVQGEGLLVTPKGELKARVVALPDAGQTPEQIMGLAEGVKASSQFARRLAESGVQVLIPALINRKSTYSGSAHVAPWSPWDNENLTLDSLMTNMTHREWIYRQAYVMGRHIIGVEVQKTLAGIDWFEKQGAEHVGVAGYGEGGLLALYATAVDDRIDAALVSGYFGPREDLWQEPVARNVWGLLKRFGDAEIASMAAPRPLVIEHSPAPDVDGPPEAEEGEIAAATPGHLTTPTREAVQRETERLRGFFSGGDVKANVQLITGDGPKGTTELGSTEALSALLDRLDAGRLAESGAAPADQRADFAPTERQGRMVHRLTDHFYKMAIESDLDRYQFVDGDLSSVEAWVASMQDERKYMRNEIIGKVPQKLLPPNARTRKIYDRDEWTGHEVVLNVWPDVFAWGILAVPKGLKPGEKRPVIVMQHGVGGTPTTPIRVDSYNNVLPRLVRRGFIVFAPRNPYRFNVRKATPLKESVFSVIIPQHHQIVNWLQSREHVDPDRIALYGKSWGGRTALRVPPFVKEYSPVISSAYFTQWPRKVLNDNYRTSYMYEGSIGVYEFNLGHTMTHAEMAGLIVPRPFMVESGYHDAVSPVEWVGHEFGKVKRTYDLLGIGERAQLGAHAGGHEIHAGTTFPFLHKYLRWPVPATEAFAPLQVGE